MRIAEIPLVQTESAKIPLVKNKVPTKYDLISVFHSKIPLVTN
jgi:hypothetical protein